jgi:hypothetical protein
MPGSFHNFLRFLLYFSKQSRLGISYFQPKIVVFLVNGLYTKAIEAAKSRRWIMGHEFYADTVKFGSFIR